MKPRPAFGKALATARKQRNQTRRQVALLVDIDPSYLALMEKYGAVPHPEKVVRLARVLRLDSDLLLLLAGYAPHGNPHHVYAAIKHKRNTWPSSPDADSASRTPPAPPTP